ncbi:Uncharacterised protein [Lysinibacillus sphaericus]|nr:Uncharacterised protein [Lysinibacillus sphaericus]
MKNCHIDKKINGQSEKVHIGFNYIIMDSEKNEVLLRKRFRFKYLYEFTHEFKRDFMSILPGDVYSLTCMLNKIYSIYSSYSSITVIRKFPISDINLYTDSKYAYKKYTSSHARLHNYELNKDDYNIAFDALARVQRRSIYTTAQILERGGNLPLPDIPKAMVRCDIEMVTEIFKKNWK